jgi:tyrosyl-tRNA synthetase
MHQYLLNADDAMTPLLLRYFTFLDHDTIRSLDDAIKSAPQERAAQRTLANEVVALVHGEDAAKNAERAGEALFSEEIASLDEKTLLQVVSDAPSSKMTRSELSAGIDIVDLLVRCELASSKGEARRFLEQGGVYINNQRVDAAQPVDTKSILHDRYMVVRRGRKQMHLVVLA